MDDKLRKQEARILTIIISVLTLSLIFLAGKPVFTGLVIGNFTNITENITINESINVTIEPEQNITVNITEINESVNITLNETITNITYVEYQEEAVIETKIAEIEINKPVKWTKKINASKVKDYKLPEKAFNVKGSNYNAKKQEFDLENVDDIIDIEYFTEAPKVKEKIITKNKKQVTVSADLDYQNVLTYTDIQESREDLIKVYWLKDSGRELFTDIEYIDTNNNNLIDRLEWTIPHLSNQTFEIVIEITKAEHLDENRNFISNIYDEVIALDNDLSERIYHNEYVSVTFEKNLTSENDITVYVRNSQQLNTKIEVYYYNSAIKITEFPVIQEEKYYKIYLTDMQGTSDKFDLRIVNEQNSNGAYLEFNHIIDPSVPVVYHLKSTNIFNNVSPTGSTVTQTCYQGGAGGTCDYTFVRETAYSEATNITTDTINARIYWDTDVSCTKTQDCNLNTFFVYDCGTDSGCAAPTTICTGVEDTTCSGTTDPCYSDVSCTPASVTQMAQNDYLGFRVRILSKQENVYFRYNSSARDSWFNVTEQTVDAGGGNNDPVISWVNNSVVENPIEGSIKTISINFNVTDLDGASDLNDTSAKIYLNKTGEPSRFNASCTPSGNSGNTETYTCAIDMQFYDLSGDWTINASIQDNSHSYAENITETFTYNLLSSIKLNPIFLNFSSTLIKGAILNATNNPLLLNNTGNDNFTTIKIKALDLIGITNNNYYISATNFTASVSDVFGDQLINNTNVTISTATLNRGYNETEQIYVWVNLTKYVIPQEYNTSTLGEWIIYLE